MHIFSDQIYDDLVSGTTNVFTDTGLSETLGSVERLSLAGLALGVTGSGVTLTCQLEHSPDGARWSSVVSTAELNATTLAGGDNTFFFNTAPNIKGIMNYVRVRIALGGTSPVAVVRLWVTGRSPGE